MPSTLIPASILIEAAGGTFSLAAEDMFNRYYVTGAAAIVADVTITSSGIPVLGTEYELIWNANITKGAFNVTVFGYSMTAEQTSKDGRLIAFYNGSSFEVTVIPSFSAEAFIVNVNIAGATIENSRLADMTRGTIKVGDASDRPSDLDASGSGWLLIGDGNDINSVVQSGDVIFSSAGVSAIQAGVIVNTDINAAAAIAYSKLASLTSGNILVGSAGNVATSVAMSGDVAISNTGVTTIQAGAVDPAMLSGNGAKEVIVIPISFVTADQCDNSFILPFAGTIDSLTSYVVSPVSATDNGTITCQINGVAVTDGEITVAASSPVDTSDSASPTALNVFAAGDRIDLVSLKTTTGGRCLVSVTVTRT
jgi:hypothetical protein